MGVGFDKIQKFCVENAGKIARGIDNVNRTDIILGRLTSFNQKSIFLAPDVGKIYFIHSKEMAPLPYLYDNDWFVVSQATAGKAVIPQSIVILDTNKEEIEKLIKALEL